ncbi:MAG: PQQ-binding-like beta-propeller repeat protein [Planctomycetaceae bacterium]
MLIRRWLLSAVPVSLFLVMQLPAAEVSTPRHKVVAADKQHLVGFDEQGKVLWSLPDFGPVHRIQVLAQGHLLTQTNWTHLVELDANRKVVWEYDAQHTNGNAGKKLEVHAFQRLNNGNTMVVENGVGRIIEVDPAGKIVHEVKYQVSVPNAHRDVRQAYKLDSGNYLVCHEGDGRVVEYAPDGEIVWAYGVPLFDKPPVNGHGPEAWGNQAFNARRMPNGNTLIATGNGHSVIEVTPAKQVVWQVQQQDLSGITLAWTTTLEVLPNGNILLGNCHAGPDNPQLIELTRDKQVVWTFHDWDALGDSTAASTVLPQE